MKNLMDFSKDLYGILLASDKVDASHGALEKSRDVNRIPPDNVNRTILIGIGGTGIKTIDYVKRKISDLLAPGWDQYIAFLGIDSHDEDFINTAKLQSSEIIQTTLDKVADRAKRAASYPGAWRRFVDPEVVKQLPSLNSKGAARKRLIGKMKIHDCVAGGIGVDQEIVNRLRYIKGSQLLPLEGNGNYEVYVIGSVSGGTCSGGFLEMPALIHEAIADSNTHIHAMLYLPDTLISLDPKNKAEIEANGYASLKELNYFQGLQMRLDYPETFSYNDPAQPELKITPAASQGFFTIPYLIGTPAGAAADSDKRARETIAEFLISTLGRMPANGQNTHLVGQFISNANGHATVRINSPANPEKEADGEAHEFPKHYGAIGFAKAAAPKEIIRAYVAGEACKKAGLKPVSASERAEMVANGVTLLPFAGEKDFLPPNLGSKTANELITPLLTFINRYQGRPFSLEELPNIPTLEWKEIKRNSFNNAQFLTRVNRVVEKKTNTDSLNTLKEDVQKAFQAFRAEVQSYVKKEGPFAFCNVFDGKFDVSGAQNSNAVGIRTIIERLCKRQNIDNGKETRKETIDDAKKRLDDCRTEVSEVSNFNILGEKQRKAQAWVNAFNAWVNRRINTVLEDYLLGDNGYLQKEFLEPALVLVDQVRCFGNILERLSSTYENLGNKLTDYNQFRNVTDDSTEVNIAAVNQRAHAWIKEQAAQAAKAVEGITVRNTIVDSFFEAPNSWLEFRDELIVQTTSGSVSLTNPDLAVDARRMFDKCLGKTVEVNLDVSVEKLFESVKENGIDYTSYAAQIMRELRMKSKVLFDGRLSESDYHRYIMYPASLNADNQQIVDAIRQQATQTFPGIGFYWSDFTDSIMLYQMVMPFEVYRLNQLPAWELQYEHQLNNSGNGMHGRSQDLTMSRASDGTVSYSDITPWKDYPAITYQADPKKKDPSTGAISREGVIRLAIDNEIEEAKRLGVLYCDKDENGKYQVYRVFCDRATTWRFDPGLMLPDKKGLLPMGKELAQAIADQNRKKISEISREVSLNEGGLLSQSHTTEEWAWYYAARVLYSHRPMLREIRDTLVLFRDWSKEIAERNEKVLRSWLAAKMIRLIHGRILYPDNKGRWLYQRTEGGILVVANLSDENVNYMRISEPKDAALIQEGFSLYYIYKMLQKTTISELAEIDAAVDRAKAEMADSMNRDLIVESYEFTNKILTAETDLATKLGINLVDPEKQYPRVLASLNEKLIENDIVRDIAVFYQMAGRWQLV